MPTSAGSVIPPTRATPGSSCRPASSPGPTRAEQPKVSRTADRVILQAPGGGKKKLPHYEACTEAFVVDKLEHTHLTGEDGQGLITVSSWPGDAAWSDYVVGEIETARPWLNEHLGGDTPLAGLTFRETASQGRYSAAGDDRPIDGIIGLIEGDYATGAVAERLARTWFGPERVSEPWLAEGLAMWAGRSAVGEPCPVPALPEAGPDDPVVDPDALIPRTTVDLDDWTVPVLGTDEPLAWQRSRYQSSVTCGIVERAAAAVGDEVMTDIVAELLASPSPFGVADWLVALALASDAETVAAIRESIAEAGITA